jgi:hypothetical protein
MAGGLTAFQGGTRTPTSRKRLEKWGSHSQGGLHGKPRCGGQCESLERLRLSAGFRRPHDNHRSGDATGRRVGRSEPCRGCAWVLLFGNALVHEIQKSAGPRTCPTWSAVSWRFGCKQSPKQRSVLTCEPGWIFSSPLRTPLENVGGEIVVLEIVQAVLDHLAQVEGLAAPGLSGQVFQSLLKLSRRVGMEVGIKR